MSVYDQDPDITVLEKMFKEAGVEVITEKEHGKEVLVVGSPYGNYFNTRHFNDDGSLRWIE